MESADLPARATRSLSPTTTTAASSPNPILDVLAEMNNEGATHLENGFFEEAISTFRSAMAMAIREESIRQLLLVGEYEGCITGLLGGISSSGRDESSSVPRPSLVAAKPKKTKRRKARRSNSMSSMGSKGSISARHPPSTSRRGRRRELFRRVRSAMGLNAIDNGDDTTTTEDVFRPPQKHVLTKPQRVRDYYNLPGQAEIAIYLVHNLALAYQLQALSSNTMIGAATEEGDATNWERIILLYKLASQMIVNEQKNQEESADANIDPNSPLWSPTSIVALPNNIACAYHASGNDAQADEVWQLALIHIWCMLDVGCISEVEFVSEILENASHLMDSGATVRPAPAA